jgi:hypothetical protein
MRNIAGRQLIRPQKKEVDLEFDIDPSERNQSSIARTN